jgi:drug/metabolite transporter (DMT)-like permease
VGVVLGLVAMLVMSIGIVIAKPVLARSDPWWAITVRLAGGVVLPAALSATPRHRKELVSAFGTAAAWRAAVPAALTGTYLAMIFWILGMKFTLASKASVLNQTSTVFTLLLAAVFLREPLTWRKIAALGLGFAGAAIAVV